MNKTIGKLTVFFDKPFWVGVFERFEDGKLSVCKVTFGAEPKDYEVYEFILNHYFDLKFSSYVITNEVRLSKKNPKRMQREAKKQLLNKGIGTKSQQILKLHQEQTKTEHKLIIREQRQVEKKRQFELKQQKRKEKHKGH